MLMFNIYVNYFFTLTALKLAIKITFYSEQKNQVLLSALFLYHIKKIPERMIFREFFVFIFLHEQTDQ